ncbi:MAG: hypothetical protein QXF06_05450 [Archaeoglobaceae archaeon]
MEIKNMKIIQTEFELQNFLRIIYKNEASKGKYSKIFQEAQSFVSKLEILTVLEGLRKCAWQTIAEEQQLEYVKRLAKLGLITLPVRFSKRFEGFAHRFEEAKAGERRNLSIIISKNIYDALEFEEAYWQGDHIKQGEMLGFPECCARFFSEVWAQGYFDPIWQIAKRSEIIKKNKKKLVVRFHPLSNPLLRYVGIRFSFHIPCSFNCAQSVELASRIERIARRANNELVDEFMRLLSKELSWSVNHGIAVVRDKEFLIIYNSVPTSELYEVELKS